MPGTYKERGQLPGIAWSRGEVQPCIVIISSAPGRKLQALSLIYRFFKFVPGEIRPGESGRQFASRKGIIIADTKFEFGLLGDRLILIDEVLTPDSSRFWPMDTYSPGGPQKSFDKQFLRDYLNSLDWPKSPPPPRLPGDVIEKTRAKYLEALERLTGKD